MFDFIDRVRAKPESYRVWVAIVTAVVITFCIVGLWLLTLDFDTSGKAPVARGQGGTSPFATIQSGFTQFLDEGAAQFDAFRVLFLEQATTTEDR